MLGGGISAYDNKSFYLLNYFEDNLDRFEFDYAISSQAFNDLYSEDKNNMCLITDTIGKLYRKARKGVSFNFVTDKVQFIKPGVAYHNPEDIIRFAYNLSNCVFMDNGCMPYECTCTILKDVASDGLVFDTYRKKYEKLFNDGVFIANTKR